VLAAAMNRDDGLAAGAVRFSAVGQTAWCYRVTDERGRRWFLELAELQRLPREAELLAFKPGCDEYCEREVDEVQWQGGPGLPAPRNPTGRSACRRRSIA
jgi:hypothetical protein